MKTAFTILAFIAAACCCGQNRYSGRTIRATDSLCVGNRWISLIDTASTLAANSDKRIPTQKAIKAYVATMATGGAHTHPASDIVSGTFVDARIAQSNVTQYQAALTIAESQVPNLVSDLSAKQPLITAGAITDYYAGDKTMKVHNLESISDVAITGIANNNLLKYNSANQKWENWVNNFLTANQSITLSGDISGTGQTAITTAIGSNKVLDAMLRQSSGLSILGRSANTTGNIADITAVNDNEVMRRSGTAIGFGTVATGGITNNAVSNAKLAQMATNTIKGNNTVGTADPTDIALAADQVLMRSGSANISGGTIVTNHVTNNAISNAKLAQMATNTIKGNNTVGTADPIDLTVAQTMTLLAAAPLASPTFTGTPAGPTAATGTNSTQLATTAFVQAASDYGSYQTILEASGSHTAGKVAATYALGDGYPTMVSGGTGSADPIKTIFIAAADYPSVDGKAAKLRLRVQLYVNDVAPTGNYTFGLYPITRPATSGGTGLNIYTLGTVVTNSTVLFTTPAADGLLNGASTDFSLPSDGHYVIGVVTTATVAVSSHLHMSTILQKRNN